LTSVIGLYYYAYVVWRMYFPGEGEFPGDPVPVTPLMRIILGIAALGVLMIGIYPRPFLDLALAAARAFAQ